MFNAGERGIIEGKVERVNAKKLKVLEKRDGKKYDWDESLYKSDNTKGWVERT